MKTKWADVPFAITIEVCREGNKVLDTDGNELDIDGLAEHVDIDGCELVIACLSSGTDTPASMHGGTSKVGWPAERDEERRVERVYLLYGQDEANLPDDIQEAVGDWFAEAIEEFVIEEPT